MRACVRVVRACVRGWVGGWVGDWWVRGCACVRVSERAGGRAGMRARACLFLV